MPRTERAERLLDAAVDVIGSGGMRALTHRAVDGRAGLPPGSSSYWFRTRRDLVEATLRHLAERDAEHVERLTRDRGDAVEALAALLQNWLGPGRIRTAARLELFLEASRSADLRPVVAEWRDQFRELARRSIGDGPDMEVAARRALAAIDGLLLDRLATGEGIGADEARVEARAILTAAPRP